MNMQKKIIIKFSFIFSLLLITTAMFYSSSAVSHHKRRHHIHHITVKKQAASDQKWDVNPHVWNLALKAYNHALQKGYIKQKIITIIDYSLPSSVKRLWVVDITRQKVLYHTLVAHGKHTGGLVAKHFSDKPGSLASSLGLFLTENTYIGSKGYSLRLRGLEPGFNDMARSRAIVMHGAWYATSDFAAHHGRLGLSWGCPAVSPQLARPIINDIKGGSLVFAYYPDTRWLQRSKFLL
jgi:L,D-transpeptidase catalytic domain